MFVCLFVLVQHLSEKNAYFVIPEQRMRNKNNKPIKLQWIALRMVTHEIGNKLVFAFHVV